MQKNKDIALGYLKKGISVIPIGNDKRPLIQWAEFQTRKATIDEVENWWKQHPEANIGIITGKISNLLVVDVDNKNGKIGSTKGLPPTLIAKTGGGGWHYYYRYTEAIGNKIRIRENVDIKGDGGYVVAPPSMHASGNRYEWAVIEEPQPFPIELFKDEFQVKTHDWEKLMTGSEEGSRNQNMSVVLGKLLHAFKENEWMSSVWPVFIKLNQLNTPPLEDSELRAIFNSITTREKRKNTDETDIVLLSKAAKENFTEDRPKFATGFGFIDKNTKGGIREGDLIIISGKTGEGKTHFAQTITYHLAENKIPSLWFSYEVAYDELWQRFKDMGVDEDFISYVPLKLISGKLDWIAKQIRIARETVKTKVVFLDHLEYLVPGRDAKLNGVSTNFATYVGMICRELKLIAVSEQVVMVAMSHVRRTNDPTIDDLKDSSSVGQEADIVVMLKRLTVEEERRKKDKYSAPSDEDDEVYSEFTRASVVKNRRTGITKKDKLVLENGRFVSKNDEFEKI